MIDELGKLPGIGPKSAQRIAFHLLSVEPPDIDRLTAVLGRVRDGVTFCDMCGNVSDAQRCRICSDPRRDGTLVCVVEEPKDVQAVERTREPLGLHEAARHGVVLREGLRLKDDRAHAGTFAVSG